MALLGQQLYRSRLTSIDCSTADSALSNSNKSAVLKGGLRLSRCSGIAIDSPAPLAGGVAGVRWGSLKLQSVGVIAQPESLRGFSFGTAVDQSWLPSLSIRSQASPRSKRDGGGRRRVWRRRKLSRKDATSDYKLQRVPFLEEQVRKINEGGGLMSMDIERLLLSEDNRFEFVNDVAAEAKAYVESNRDEYGHKKAILHVLSNRMNDIGFYRPEAYMETDPFKPGPTFLKDEQT